jgi:hypothetical protein
MIRPFIIASFLLLFVACSSPFNYLGKTYPPTMNPELFFREQDIGKDYEIMGKLQVEMPGNKNMEKIQRRIMQKAAQNGADAVLIDNFDLVTGGFATGGVGAGKRGKKGGSVGVSTSKTKVEKDVLIEATLIKYRPKK